MTKTINSTQNLNTKYVSVKRAYKKEDREILRNLGK